MAKTSFQGVVRSYGGQDKNSGVTPGVMTQSEVISFNAGSTTSTQARIGASATTGEYFVLPSGAVPIQFAVTVAATGATATVDIGSSADDNGFFDEAVVGVKGTITGANGAEVIAAGITSNTTVYGMVGDVAGTGTVTGVFTYAVADNGKPSE